MRRLLFLFMMLSAMAKAEVPTVATDIAPVHAMVAQVMKGVGEPKLVIPPGASPHGYAMRPSEARASSRADLVVWVGPGLTPWLSGPLETLAGEARHLTLLDVAGMVLLPFREGAGFEAHDHSEHGHEDHEEATEHEEHAEEEGHDHEAHDDGKDHAHEEEHAHEDEEHAHEEHAGEEGTDPHLWLDPKNGAQAMLVIAETLAEMDPANAAAYRANAQSGQERLIGLSDQVTQMLTGLADRPFIVFHDAFHYFEARFAVEAIGAVSAGDAAKPGAARIAELRGHIAETGAHCAFAEPQMNTELMQTGLEGHATKLPTLDPLGASLPLGPDLYPDLLLAIAGELSGCLSR